MSCLPICSSIGSATSKQTCVCVRVQCVRACHTIPTQNARKCLPVCVCVRVCVRTRVCVRACAGAPAPAPVPDPEPELLEPVSVYVPEPAYLRMFASVHACVQVYSCVRLCECMCMFKCTQMCMCMDVHVRNCVDVFVHHIPQLRSLTVRGHGTEGYLFVLW